MHITLLLGTFYALTSLSTGCFSTKTNKYNNITCMCLSANIRSLKNLLLKTKCPE